jgi:hypothetical protein
MFLDVILACFQLTTARKVNHVASCPQMLLSSKEYQTTPINLECASLYHSCHRPLRRSVHNTPDGADEVAYRISFQVDLMEQPPRILDKLLNGSYHSINNSLCGLGRISSNGGLPSMSHSTQGVDFLSAQGGAGYLLSRVTLILPNHHLHRHPDHHHRWGHCVQTIRPMEQRECRRWPTLDQERGEKRSYFQGVRDGCLSCGGVALGRQVTSVVFSAQEMMSTVALA